MPKIVDHQQRRQQIASTAVKLIATQGLENTSIRNIARESGYSKGIIEHYFDNKDELISYTLNWMDQSYIHRIASAMENLNGLEALERRIKETLPLNPATREEWSVRLRFWSLATVQKKHQKIQSERFKLARQGFLKDLKQAKNLRELDSEFRPITAVNRILFTISGASISSLHSPYIISIKQLSRLPKAIIKELKN
jgi:AcrR family transcriptional regulator